MEEALERKLDAFKRDFSYLYRSNTARNYDWLPAFYLRAAYFKEAFTESVEKCAVCGAAYDGGLDAVFRNPNHDANEVVIVQSKCYENAIRPDGLRAELCKIARTLRKLQNREKSRLADRARDAFRRAVNMFEEGEDIEYAIDFVTSWIPNDRQRNALENIADECRSRMCNLSVSRITLIFGDRLLEQAESLKVEREFIDHDSFRWYKSGGCLRYGKSFVVNLRASSLRDVYRKHGVGVLGLNLRYHVTRNKIQKDVDSKIEDTIRGHADDFWFFNNGIMIVCRAVRFDRRKEEMELFDYSIVNGGQTTYNIDTHWQGVDFAIVCKIVVVPNIKVAAGKKFAQDIAVSANSQKPILASALVANNIEQRKLGDALEDCGVYYIRKEGDKPDAKRFEMREGIEEVGKLGLCGLLLMPMEARNKKQLMFDPPYYDLIFKKNYARLFKDMIVLRNAYMQFCRSRVQQKIKPKWCRGGRDEWYIARNGLTFVISSWVFCVRTLVRAVRWGDLRSAIDDPKTCVRICGDLRGVDGFVSEDFNEHFIDSPILWHVFEELVHVIYDAYRRCADDGDEELLPVAFLKKRDVFVRYIAPLLRAKCRNKRFKKQIIKLAIS